MPSPFFFISKGIKKRGYKRNTFIKMAEKTEYLFKVLVIGDVGCGKTSLVRRFIHDSFSEQGKPTIGVDFALKVMEKPNCIVRMQLWDIAGQERFGNMTRIYYKDAVAALILMDITQDQKTLEGARRWKRDLDEKVLVDDEPVPALLICNKIDASTEAYREKVKEQLEKVAEEDKFRGYLMTSVKNNENIDSAFDLILKEIMSKKSNLIEGETRGKKKESGNVTLRPVVEEETCMC